jgi:DNA repair protein RadC
MKYDAIYESRQGGTPAPAGSACGCKKSTPVAGAGYASRVQDRAPKDIAGVLGRGPKGMGGSCRPWTRLERDEPAYEACMAFAEQLGPIDSAKKAFEVLKRSSVAREDQEVFGAMYLDTHLYLRDFAETARGEVDAVMAPIKPTLRIATLRLAMDELTTGLLIFHCHPTLYSQPSDADKQVTKAFEEACETLDLFFVDHIVVGGMKEYFSFDEHGLLQGAKRR